MDEIFEEEDRKPSPILAGWSPGEEERPVPGLEHITWEMYEEAKKSRNQPKLAKYVCLSDIYDRQDKQLQFAREQVEKGIPLVLLTKDLKVYRANGIIGLLWIYILVKLHISSPKTK